MQSKGRGKKTLGSDGRGARNNQVLTPMEDAADRKWKENTWKEWNENPWKGVKGTISCLLKWKMHRKGRVHKLPFSAKKLRVHSTTKPTKAKTP
jgi:hypothetical protein